MTPSDEVSRSPLKQRREQQKAAQPGQRRTNPQSLLPLSLSLSLSIYLLSLTLSFLSFDDTHLNPHTMNAIPHLQKQLREMTNNPPPGFRVEAGASLFVWTVWFTGPEDTPYYGGQFKATLTFPKEFPMEPPVFKILSKFWHPNVYADGRICISILHPPGEDEMNSGETAMMRWTPVQTIHSVLISIMSLLSDPDPRDSGAPANVDALVQFRSNRAEYDRTCRELVERSQREVPPDFVWLQMEEEKASPPPQTTSLVPTVDYPEDEEDDTDDLDFIPSPAAAPSGPERYRDELGQIRSLGIVTPLTDDEILQILVECRGDLGMALEKIGM